MAGIWVCKFDGTIQCQNDPEIPLDVMRVQLAALIGAENILDEAKRYRLMPQLCGLPTGALNAYEITEEGYRRLMSGIVGPQGFHLCEGSQPAKTEATRSPKSVAEILPISGIGSVGNIPVLVRELIGRPVRLYTTGDALTSDWRPDRVNIEQSKAGVIVDVWFG